MNKFDRFEQWLRDNGAQFDQLELRSYENENDVSSSTTTTAEYDGTKMAILSTDAAEEKKEPNHHTQLHRHRLLIDTDADVDTDTLLGEGGAALAMESEMRGVHAKTDLLPNTVCMIIPYKCLITVEMGQATEIGRLITHHSATLDLDAPKHIFLMIYILHDRKVNGKHSFFDPYYQILPPTLHNMPIFWSDVELYELAGSYILQQIHDRNQAIIDDYNTICTIAPQLRHVGTITEFKWARMCVCSRNFGLCINGVRTSALVPHADMLNHYRPRETKWTYDETLQAFTITSLQQIHRGCEVFDSYGQKCNHRFLLNYGFAIEENYEIDGFCPNEVPIEFYISPTDIIFDSKIDFWIRGSNCSAISGHTTTTTTNNNHNILQYATHPSNNSNKSNTINNTLTAASRENISQSTLKRVRICVTNNENTRLLLSLLRIIVATPDEFHISITLGNQITTTGSIGAFQNNNNTATTISVNGSGFTSFGYNSSSLQQQQQQHEKDHTTLFVEGTIEPGRQFGSTAQQHMSSATINSIHRNGFIPATAVAAATVTSSNTAMATARYHRSCRDIRHPINLRNEREVMKLLRVMIQQLLTQYPTTLQQDIEALHMRNIHEYPKFSNRRHAKIQVKGEKMVLHHYLKWAQMAIDVLNVIESEIREEIEQYNIAMHHAVGSTATLSSSPSVSSTVYRQSATGIEVRWQDRDTSSSTTTSIPTEQKNINAQTPSAIVDPQNTPEHVQPSSVSTYTAASSYDMIIRRMEDDMKKDEYMEDTHDVHHTILRYCSDVLGHVRQEEFRQLRKELLLQQQRGKRSHSKNPDMTTTAQSTRSSNNNNGNDKGNRRGSEYV